MRWSRGAVMTACLMGGACHLDLIDPEIRPGPVSFSFFIDAREQAIGQIEVDAFLSPGIGEDGAERHVASGFWTVNDVQLRSDRSYASGLLQLSWDTVLTVARTSVLEWRFDFPAVEAVTVPDDMIVELRSRSGSESEVWVAGSDLDLFVGEMGSGARSWMLLVEGWRGSGNPVQLLSRNTLGRVPSEVLIPGGWLPASGFDSLRVALTYDSSITASTADSAYVVQGLVRQRSEWRFRLVAP